MSLRARLSAAFVVVVLVPVVLGALLVGATAATASQDRAHERLDQAAASVRTALGALCERLHLAAETVALLAATARGSLAGRTGPSAPADPPGPTGDRGTDRGPAVAARAVVFRGLASAVRVTAADGTPVAVTPAEPAAGLSLPADPGQRPPAWADCAPAPPGTSTAPPGTGPAPPGTGPAPPGTAGTVARYAAIAARVEVRDRQGALRGTVDAAQTLDRDLVGRLAAAGGTAVTVLAGTGRPGGEVLLSTEPAARWPAVVTAARDLDGTGPAEADQPGRSAVRQVGETPDGRYVRRLDPAPGQPLALVLSVPGADQPGRYTVLLGSVLVGGLLAAAGAVVLARSATRPLTEFASAVDRAAGDLTARVPASQPGEVGLLAGAFNRMTRQAQAYVQALTASRDQLREQLAVLGDTLSSTHDLDRILRVILRTALAATGARAGVVLLLDPATGTLVGEYATGLGSGAGPTGGPGAAGRALRVPLGSGLLGAVAATGVPLRGRVDRDGPVLAPGEPGCRTYVAVPFSAPGGRPVPDYLADPHPWRATGPARGVLALYDRLGNDDFDDADLLTLRTFAGQAAVAVDNVRAHEQAQRLSLTDPLTGLWNYRYLSESIRREVERASRFGRVLSVLALDLDRFKEVNDTYGHAVGDAVLAEFARRIRAEIREVDLAFRQGGEEFVVLLPETDLRGAATVAGRLGAATRNTAITIDPPVDPAAGSRGPAAGAAGGQRIEVEVTVSIGIAAFPDHAATAALVLDAADDALYAAKTAGRDTYRVAPLPAARTGGAGPEPSGATG